MKPILRFKSQLLYRKSYKPIRTIRTRPLNVVVFRPKRDGPTNLFYENQKRTA